VKNIRFAYDNLWDIGTLVPTTEDSPSFLAINTRHDWRKKSWRSTSVAAEQSLYLDCGTPVTAQCGIICFNNFLVGATVGFYGNSINTWGSPAFSEVIAVVNNGVMGSFWTAAKTYQYWKVGVTDTGNSDGFTEIGKVFLGPYSSPVRNFDMPYTQKFVDPSSAYFSVGGQKVTVKRDKFRKFSITFTNLSKADRDLLWALYDKVGIHSGFFVCMDADGTFAEETIYAGFESNPLEVQHKFIDNFFDVKIDLYEVF
jgi:hypothetical protein